MITTAPNGAAGAPGAPDAPADAPVAPDAPAGASPEARAADAGAHFLEGLDERVRALDGEVRRFVVERPVVALAAAVAGGFLIGRLLSRR